MAGGGFLSLASFSGLIAGMLRVRGKSLGQERPTLSGSGLLDHYGTISTVSGGSWFLAELAYSASFRGLIEEIAANPDSAGELFNKRWSDPWIDSFTGGDNGFKEAFAQIAEKFGQPGLAQDVRLLGTLWSSGLTWPNFLNQLLDSTAAISADTPLGAPVEDWANGKLWMLGHSLVTPSDGEQGSVYSGVKGSTFYSCDRTTPVYIPAKFSITLGAGTGAAAPVPYCAPSALAASTSLRWETPNTGFCFCSSNHRAKSQPLGDFSNLTAAAGSLPLCQTVGCSSAFLGGFLLNDIVAKIKSALHGAFPLWASNASEGKAFEAAEKIVETIRNSGRPATLQQCDDLADLGVRALIDGAYTENTGIAHAVASGATDVTAFISTELEQLFGMFQGSPTESQSQGVTFLSYSIFAEHHTEIRDRVTEFQSLVMPEGNRVLQGLVVGTLVVTTMQNDSFGITGGRQVTLRIISVSSSLSIGYAEDFREYGVFLGQLVREYSDALAMEQNSNTMDEFVRQMAR